MDPLAYLFSLEQFGIKLGLENISRLCEALGNPHRGFRSIHVAGTNGKGSVCAMIETALRTAGHRTARYTSPHLVALEERFVIGGAPVTREALTACVADVRAAVEALQREGALQVHPTFFEATTAVAFELFRRAGVEIAVIEVGLGGRWDATNVLAPIAGAISSIALDHERHLGSSIEAIAGEKAGIAKPGMPVVVGRVPAAAARAIERVCQSAGSPLVHAADGVSVDVRALGWGTEVTIRTPQATYGPLALGLAGRHQVDNAVLAVRVLEAVRAAGVLMPAEAIAEGLSGARWRGRLERIALADGREVLLDAAHNPAGAAALAAYLDEAGAAPLPIVFAAMQDKDAAGMLAALAPVAALFVVTRPAIRRAADPAHLATIARAAAPHVPVEVVQDPIAAIERGWRAAPRVAIAGSMYLLGDVLPWLDRQTQFRIAGTGD